MIHEADTPNPLNLNIELANCCSQHYLFAPTLLYCAVHTSTFYERFIAIIIKSSTRDFNCLNTIIQVLGT